MISLNNLEINNRKTKDEKDSYVVLNERVIGQGIIINSKFLNGAKVPEESINKTIDILENKNLGKEK